LRIERCRSLSLQKLSPKSLCNDHVDSPPGEHYLRPVMDIVDGRLPVRSFVVLIALGATQAQERFDHCLAADSSANLDLEAHRFYLNDSPSLLPLNHREIAQRVLPAASRHRLTVAAAKDLPGLVTTFTLMVTLLGGTAPRPLLYVQASRPSIVSAPQVARFLGIETRSVPLPTSNDSLRFGTVSISVHFQALTRLSWLSFSPPAFSAGRRGLNSSSAAVVTKRRLPTEARLNEPFGHEPPGRDL